MAKQASMNKKTSANKKAAAKDKASITEQTGIHIIEELEEQFDSLQKRISELRNDFLAEHQKEVRASQKRLKSIRDQLNKARTEAGEAVVKFGKAGTDSARNQLKKVRAASLLLGESLKEAGGILVTTEDRLHAMKPFDSKLAARAKVLEDFEKDWDAKLKAEAGARSRRARKTTAKGKTASKKKAAKTTASKKKAAKATASKKKSTAKTAARKATAKSSGKKASKKQSARAA